MHLFLTLLISTAAAAPAAINHLPHFHGIFVALTNATSLWTQEQWETDISSMKEVGMTFFVLPHTARFFSNATASCPNGIFESYFPPTPPLNKACFRQVGRMDQLGTVGTVLAAAAQVGVEVHLGMALTHLNVFDETTTKNFAYLQWQVVQALWSLYPKRFTGVYTEIEQSNSAGWFSQLRLFAQHYLQPIASDVHTIDPNLLVWSSPYSIGNRSRFSPSQYTPLRVYGEMWEQNFIWAPDLGAVAPQDSMGAQGNSFANAGDALRNISQAARRQGRQSWANVELFEVWPRSCQGHYDPPCSGRHPAPWSRIEQQMANEAGILEQVNELESPGDAVLIAWEWYSCLSPNGGADNQWANVTRANYQAYQAYLAGV